MLRFQVRESLFVYLVLPRNLQVKLKFAFLLTKTVSLSNHHKSNNRYFNKKHQNLLGFSLYCQSEAYLGKGLKLKRFSFYMLIVNQACSIDFGFYKEHKTIMKTDDKMVFTLA